MRLSHAAAWLGLLVVLSASPARAQGRDAATADALFRDARALMKSGDFKAACPKLAESQRLDPAPGTAINLGDCWEKLGKLADALQSYRDALDLLKPGDQRIGPAKEQIAALEKRVPKLTIKLAPGAPEGARVKRDDVELGDASLGVALPVNPGEHWVVVVAPGRSDSRKRILVTEGKSESLTLQVGDASSSSPTSAPHGSSSSSSSGSEPDSGSSASSGTSADSGSTQRTLGYVAGAVGLVSLGLAAVYYGKAQSVGTECSTTAACNDLKEEDQGYRDTATLWGIVGGIGVAGGLALIFSAPTGSDAKSAGIGLAPSIAGYSVQLAGTW